MPAFTIDDEEPRGPGAFTLDDGQVQDVDVSQIGRPGGVSVAAPGAEPEAKPKRKPIEAGVARAYGQLRYGVPLAIETAAGRADPEKVAELQEGLRRSGEVADTLLPGGPMGLGELADNPLGIGRFLGENLAYSAPQMAASVGGAVAGGLAGTAVAGPAGTVVGGIGGAIVAGTPGFVGSNVDRATEGGQETLTRDEANRSLLVAPLQAGADAAIGRFIPGVGKLIPGAPVVGQTLGGRVASGLAGGAATEGVTEAGQQVGERYAAGLDLMSPEAGGEYVTAGVTGGILGGAVGAGGAVLGRNDTPADQRQASNFDPNQGVGVGAAVVQAEPAPTYGVRPGPDGSQQQADLFADAPAAPRVTNFDRMVEITGFAESGNRERDANGNLITSPAGAQGKMQVMPGTNLDPGFGVTPARDGSDAERTRVGRDYLAAMLRRYGGDPAKAWAAYNWGPGNLDRALEKYGANWLRHAPAETQKYVKANVAKLGGAGIVVPTGASSADASEMPDLTMEVPDATNDFDQAILTRELREAFGGPADTDVLKLGRELTIAFEQADAERGREYIAAQQKALEQSFNRLAREQAQVEETAAEYTNAEQAQRLEKIDAKLGALVRRQNMLARGNEIIGRWEQANLTQPELPLSGQAPSAPAIDPADPAPVGGAPAGAAMEGNPRTARERTVEAVRPFLTDPEPDPVVPPTQPAAQTELAMQLANEAGQESIRNNAARERMAILDVILKDPETRRPTQRFAAELKRKGFDGALTAQETEAIAAYEQQVEEATLGVQERGAAAEPGLPPPRLFPRDPRVRPPERAPEPARGPSGPNTRPFELTRQTEADVEAQTRAAVRRERKVGQAADAQPGPANGDLFEEADRIARENVRKRAGTYADSLGSTRRNWFLKGARRALGEDDGNPPVGKTQIKAFEEGRAFVERELGLQREEGRGGTSPGGDVAPVADHEPAAAVAAAEDPGVANPDPAQAAKGFRGSKKQALARAVEAEQKGEITAKTGQIIRTMGDMEDVKAPELWDVLDSAIANKGEVASVKARRTSSLPRINEIDQRDIPWLQTELAKALRAELDALGLHDVGLKLSTRIGQLIEYGMEMEGSYDFAKQLITVSMDADKLRETLHHEAIHAMKDIGLFTEAEWRALQVDAINDPEIMDWVDRNYPDVEAEERVEEAIAEKFGRWQERRRDMGAVGRVFAKIQRFLKAIARVFARFDYRTADDIFSDIADGTIGRRPRGVSSLEIRQTMGELRGPAAKRASAPVERLPEPLQKPARSLAIALKGAAKKGHVWSLFTEDLANAASKVLPSAKKFIELNSRNHALARRFADQIADIKREYEKLPPALRGKGPGTVNRYLYDSRMAKAWGFQPEYLTKIGKTVKIDPDMKAKFDALPAAAQNVIRAVYQHNFDARREMLTAINQTINAEFDEQIAKASGDERTQLEKAKRAALKDFSRLHAASEELPYSPLKRSGNWVVVGMSPEYVAAKDAGDKKAMGELRGDEAHYYVDFRDTEAEAKFLAERMGQKFPTVQHFENDSVAAEEIGGNELFMAFGQLKAKIAKALNQGDDSPEMKKLHRLATDLYLHSLSETSARKSELKADMVSALDPFTGEAIDMMKAFVTRGEATTHFVAAVSNAQEMYGAIEALREEAASTAPGREERERFRNELVKRYVATLNRPPAPIVEKITRFTSLWQLLLQPFYYIQNATQPLMLSLPSVGAEVGYDKAWSAFGKAYADIAPLVKNSRADERIDLRQVPADVKDVVEHLLARGRLDAGLHLELGSWEGDPNSRLGRAWTMGQRALQQTAQKVETVNRVVTGIAAYRTHLAKHGDKAKAEEFASEVIYQTHGDYSGFNTPAIMGRGGASWGRVILQFRKFQLITAGHFARMWNNSLSKDLTPAERRVARRMLAFTLAHAAATTGLVGMPGAALVGWATIALADSLDGERDDYDDWEKELDELLPEGFLGDLLKKGAPYALLNVDVSGKLGFGQTFSLAPYSDVDKALTGRDAMYQTIGQLAGPFGTIMAKGADAAAYAKEGDLYRAFETALPNGIEDFLKAARYLDRGITKRGGDTLVSPEEISAVDAIYAGLGLNTRALAERSQAASQTFEATEHYKGKTTTLKRRYVNAYDRGDAAALAAVREDWKELQAARKKDGFKVQPMSVLLKAVRERARRERRTVGGVQYTPQNRGFVEDVADD